MVSETNQTPFVWSFAFQPAGIVNGEPYKGLCKILPIPGPRKLVTGIFLHGLFHGSNGLGTKFYINWEA